MGFENEKPRATYIYIVEGKLAMKADSETPNAVKRLNKNKQEVWEQIYPAFTGVLVNIECVKNDKLGSYEYRISLDDFGKSYILTIPTESKYGDQFAIKFMHLKKGKEYKFSPFSFMGEDKDGKSRQITGINIFDGDEKLMSYFPKEDPKDHPKWPQNADEDEYKAFKIMLRKFYRGLVDKWQTGQVKEIPAPVIKEKDPSWTKDDNDDLPF